MTRFATEDGAFEIDSLPSPRAVRMSRGYRVRANDMLLCVNNPAAIERLA